jgi:ATP/maltotriose-dependent transcriptional regulator MalT
VVVVSEPDVLVGRGDELGLLVDAVDRLCAGSAGVVCVEGAPGIGKSRLLEELAAHAARKGCVVLGGRAAELEDDLPYAVWADALEAHLSGLGERRLRQLGLEDPAALVAFLLAFAEIAVTREPVDRHRVHVALRDLLARLSTVRPLVLVLDDVQWADPASVDAVAALARRLPEYGLLMALAVREGRLPTPLTMALSAVQRTGQLTRVGLVPLGEADAAKLVGVRATDPTFQAIYRQSGGNPFYLQELARAPAAAATVASSVDIPAGIRTVLTGELALLPAGSRRVLEAAAVVGDPFEPDLVAEVAEIPEANVLDALDDLLGGAFVRAGDLPRRFAFRHPIVREAVYAGTPGGWRLAAHGRAAIALEQRGASLAARAHHVQYSARRGDWEAIELLSMTARQLHGPAPATAARLWTATIALLPEDAIEQRVVVQTQLAETFTVSGHPSAARRVLRQALEEAPDDARFSLLARLAISDMLQGRHDECRQWIEAALVTLPATPTDDRVVLFVTAGVAALLAGDLAQASLHGRAARDDARTLADAALEGFALALLAATAATGGDGEGARRLADDAGAIVGALDDRTLVGAIPALWQLGWTDSRLGRFEVADSELQRGIGLARVTGRFTFLYRLVIAAVRPLRELGRLNDALDAAEEAVELARLAGDEHLTVVANCELAAVHHAIGDATSALRAADDAALIETPRTLLNAAQPGWCHGIALIAAGNPARGLAALLEACSPDVGELPPPERALMAADLVEAYLALGQIEDAEAALRHGEHAAQDFDTPHTLAVLARARAAIMLARVQPDEAIAAARMACHTGSPLLAARARLLEGQALAAADRQCAISILLRAERELASFGAQRWRAEATRELRRLGHRSQTTRSAPSSDPHSALEALTAREHEIAELVSVGHTNRQIAHQLILSDKTIQTHLRNIYAKLNLRSRVELTHAIARAAKQSSTPNAAQRDGRGDTGRGSRSSHAR